MKLLDILCKIKNFSQILYSHRWFWEKSEKAFDIIVYIWEKNVKFAQTISQFWFKEVNESKFVKKHYDRHADQSKLKWQKALDLLRKFT